MNIELLKILNKLSKFHEVNNYVKMSGGEIQGTTQNLTVITPYESPVDCMPELSSVCRALKPTSKIKLTPTKKLSIITGKTRSLVRTFSGIYPDPPKEPKMVPINTAKLLNSINILKSFTGKDNHSLWTSCLIVKDGNIMASNNVCIASMPFADVPDFIMQPVIIECITKSKSPAIMIGTCERSTSVLFEDYSMVTCANLDYNIPDLKSVMKVGNTEPIPEGIAEGLAVLDKLFTGKGVPKVYLTPDGMRSDPEVADIGHVYEMEGLTESQYSLKVLSTVVNVATHIGFASSGLSSFVGEDGLEGVFMGIR